MILKAGSSSSFLLFFFGSLLFPAAVLAQACFGNPAQAGQFTVWGGVGLGDGTTGYTLGAGRNLTGPLIVGGAVGVVDVDGLEDDLMVFSASGGYSLPTEGFEACPVFGVSYSNLSQSGSFSDPETGYTISLTDSASQFAFPLGMAVGTSIGGDTTATRLIPAAEAGLLIRRARWSREVFVFDSQGRLIDREDETNTSVETDFYVTGGGTLAFEPLFFSVGVSTTTTEEASTTISLSVGFVF